MASSIGEGNGRSGHNSTDASGRWDWITVKSLKKNKKRTVTASTLSSDCGGDGTADDSDPISSILYTTDYSIKYKKKLKEHRRNDKELAELFNVISITSGGNATSNNTTVLPEHRIAASSKKIRKTKKHPKTFKIKMPPYTHSSPGRHRLARMEQDGSGSTTETDIEESHTLRYPNGGFKRIGYRLQGRFKFLRERRYARYETKRSLDTVLEKFGPTMRFTDNDDHISSSATD